MSLEKVKFKRNMKLFLKMCIYGAGFGGLLAGAKMVHGGEPFWLWFASVLFVLEAIMILPRVVLLVQTDKLQRQLERRLEGAEDFADFAQRVSTWAREKGIDLDVEVRNDEDAKEPIVENVEKVH